MWVNAAAPTIHCTQRVFLATGAGGWRRDRRQRHAAIAARADYEHAADGMSIGALNMAPAVSAAALWRTAIRRGRATPMVTCRWQASHGRGQCRISHPSPGCRRRPNSSPPSCSAAPTAVRPASSGSRPLLGHAHLRLCRSFTLPCRRLSGENSPDLTDSASTGHNYPALVVVSPAKVGGPMPTRQHHVSLFCC
jgi:hypothetical protein